MRPMRSPLLVIDCQTEEVEFRWVAASAEALNDTELALALLWCFEAEGTHSQCGEFWKIHSEIVAEIQLRADKEPVRIEMVLYAACDKNPRFARKFHEAVSSTEMQYNNATPRSWIGKLVSHERFGVGRVKRLVGEKFDVEFLHLSGIRRVPLGDVVLAPVDYRPFSPPNNAA